MTRGTFGRMEIDWIESVAARETRKAGYTGERLRDETHSDDTKDERSIIATSQYEWRPVSGFQLTVCPS